MKFRMQELGRLEMLRQEQVLQTNEAISKLEDKARNRELQ